MPQSAEIQRLSVAGQVQLLLSERILDGRISPGSRLNEVHLAEEFGVSRTPLREALNRLHQDGLVISKPHVGFFVASTSRPEAFELYELLALLEADALELAGVPNRTALEKLEQINEEIAGMRSTEAVIRKNIAWHEALVSGCQNRMLLRIIEGIRRKVDRYECLFFAPGPDRIAESVRLHRNIMSDLSRRDLPQARRSIRQHWLTDLEDIAIEHEPRRRRHPQSPLT